MVYNIFKKIGLTITLVSFLCLFTFGVAFIIDVFYDSIRSWFSAINNLGDKNTTIYLIVLALFLLFSFGICVFLLGEIIDLFFGKYPSILLEPKDYTLTEEEKEKITVIIPAYNEEKTIAEAINSVNPFCKQVIVVDDGSTDKTASIAEENGAILVRHKLNKGLGQTLSTGVNKALSMNAEIIFNFDADLQYNAADIPKLAYYILHENYDLIMGSRLAGQIEEMNLFKKVGNKLYTKLLRYLTKTGISDGQTGFRAFTSSFAKMIKIRGDFTYTQEMILEAVSKKAKIGEIPIYFAKRRDGKSRLMHNPLHFAKASGIFLIKVIIDLNPLKVYTLLSGFIFIVGFLMGGKKMLDWLLYGVLLEPIWAIMGSVIIMNSLVIFFIALLISSTKKD
ncbi:MAG: glycosyltransferase family 2 protein [Candidatus Helarchaeota archaeon]